MEKVTFRFSTFDDHKPILAMTPGLYHGYDAMMEIYPSIMKDPTFYGVVAEAEGKIVAFGGAYVTLGGKKLYSFGGRVHEDWRKLGLYKKLKEFLRARLRENGYPGLAYEEFFTHGDNESLDRVLNSPSYRHLFTRDILALRKLSDDVACYYGDGEEKLKDIRIENIGVSGLKEVLGDSIKCSRIFPNRLFVGMKMFDPVISEIEAIAVTSLAIVASFSDGEVVQMISTGGRHRSSTYIIHFHFSQELSPVTVSKHVVLHFREHLKAFGPNTEACGVFIPSGFVENILCNVQFFGFAQQKTFDQPAILGFSRRI